MKLLSDALADITRMLSPRSSARSEALSVLSHVLGEDSSGLWRRLLLGAKLSDDQLTLAKRLGARLLLGFPLQYLLGRAGFWRQSLWVGPGVLVPRPETELLVETALGFMDLNALGVVWDAGSGSGCVARALAEERQGWRIFAFDKSSRALFWARKNLAGRGGQVIVAEADIYKPEDFLFLSPDLAMPDGVVANLPYIGRREGAGLEFEPAMALYGDGPSGLGHLEGVIDLARSRLRPGGWILLEHAQDQAEALSAYLSTRGFGRIFTRVDLNGLPRVTGARLGF